MHAHHKQNKLLFITKLREPSPDNPGYGTGLSSGLLNSAKFVVDGLNHNGISAQIVQVQDNNDIDREVTKYKPTHVIIEALWVVPSKFKVLVKLHPDVKWIIRAHSEVPFLANEGMATEWILDYLDYPNVVVSFNSDRAMHDFSKIVDIRYGAGTARHALLYLPNYYSLEEQHHKKEKSHHLDIACFGAIRPFKNQLAQAMAAIQFAQERRRPLRFHVNAGRIETGGNAPLKNIRALFDHLSDDFELVEHQWTNHDEFLKLCAKMDMGLQVSFTETFNIVTADLVSQNVPVVASPEVRWLSSYYQADPTSVDDIVNAMHRTWLLSKLGIHTYNKTRLKNFIEANLNVWLRLFM